MKRLSAVVLVLLLVFSLGACGSNKNTPGNEAAKTGKTEAEPPRPIKIAELPDRPGDTKNIICVSYEAYSDAEDKFSKYVLAESEDHELVSVKFSTVEPTDLKNLHYLLPLRFMGESIKSLGKYDAGFEMIMFKTGWGDDVEVTYNQDTGYVVAHTDDSGSAIQVRAMYDGDTDSLRVEAYKDGVLDLLFEYIRTAGGYAAQYHYEKIAGYEKNSFTPIVGFCTYRLMFERSNGSYARFDLVDAEPDSIFGLVPDEDCFIDGATHWLTITDGKFTGNIGGEAL